MEATTASEQSPLNDIAVGRHATAAEANAPSAMHSSEAMRRDPSSWLPGGVLGALRVEHIYEEWNGPVLFTCVNAAGHRYLATWAMSTARHEIWMLVAISAARLQLMHAGYIDLHDAFGMAEDTTVTRVRVPVRGGRARWRVTSAWRIPRSWLPEPLVLLCD